MCSLHTISSHAMPSDIHRYSNLTPQDRCVLLRQDAITSLKEIKQFHWTVVKSQGRSHASFLKDCSALDISIDGVQESNKAKRTLMIVSVRFGGGGIYVYRVFNPLIGIKHAKATREDIFR